MPQILNINVNVNPNSSMSKVELLATKTLKVWVKAKPLENEANEEVLDLVSEFLGLKKYQLQIIKGLKIKQKICSLILDNGEYEQIVQKLTK